MVKRPSDNSPLDKIPKRLNTHIVGRSILYYSSLPSTMDIARKMAREGVSEGTVIVAGEQTSGRGRMGRTWYSTPGSSISLSAILRPDVSQLPQLNMAAGLAIVRTIQKLTPLKPAVKWPNDILINGKKVSGILVENIFDGSRIRASIVGIGLNVSLDVSSFQDISDIATSLSYEAGRELLPGQVLPTILKEFDRAYGELQAGQNIHQKWLAHVETVGRVVRVKSGDSVEEGLAESIDADGRLWLRRSDGSLVSMVTGE